MHPAKFDLTLLAGKRAKTLPWPKNISGTETPQQPLELLAHNPRIYCLYGRAKPVRSVTEPNSPTICQKLTTAIEIMVFLCSSSSKFVFKLMRHLIHTLNGIIMTFWSRPGKSCCWQWRTEILVTQRYRLAALRCSSLFLNPAVGLIELSNQWPNHTLA